MNIYKSGSISKEASEPFEYATGLLRGRDVRLRRTTNGYTFKCICAGHKDKNPSSAIYRADDGGVKFVCYAGCSTDDFCSALGIEKRQLRPLKQRGSREWEVVDCYDYKDDTGIPRLRHVRHRNKIFQWWAFLDDGSFRCALAAGWYELWDDGNLHPVKIKDGDDRIACTDRAKKPHAGATWLDAVTERYLFNRECLADLKPGDFALYLEGEKDVRNARQKGFPAVTAGGSSDWRAEHAPHFENLVLIIIPDNDEPGEKLLNKVARDSKEAAESVMVLRLDGLPPGGDLSDWFAVGGTADELRRKIETEAFEWEPETIRSEATDRATREASEAIERACIEAAPEDYDPLICPDAGVDKSLRDHLRRAGRLLNMMVLILGALGFKKSHNRILSAWLAYVQGLSTSPLAYFSVSTLKLYSKYAHKRERSQKEVKEDSQAKVVYRDIKELRDEQAAMGVTLVDYIKGKGSYSPEGEFRPAFPAKYRLRILRYALIAIRLSDSIREQNQKRWESDEIAARIVAERIPRHARSAAMNSDIGTAKARSSKPDVTEEGLMRDARALFDSIVDRAVRKGSDPETLGEEIDRVTRKFNAIASKALSRGMSEIIGDRATTEPDSDGHSMDKNVHYVRSRQNEGETGAEESGDVHILKKDFNIDNQSITTPSPYASEDFMVQDVAEGWQPSPAQPTLTPLPGLNDVLDMMDDFEL